MIDATPPSPADDPAAFVAKWRGAWPEWALVEGFVPASVRPLVEAWEALQFELQEAAWGGGDARPGEAKLGWWMDELDGWSHGRRRHPLGAVLQRRAAPWRELGRALPALAATRAQPRDADDAWSSLAMPAAAAAAVESALFASAGSAEAITASWLHARLARHPASAVPSALHPDAWARTLLARGAAAHASARARGIVLALGRARMRRGDAAAPLPPWAALWAGWRGARG